MSKPSERRDGARLDLQLRVKYAEDGGPASGEGEATDVSPRGARIEAREPLAQGSRLTFTLDAGDGQGVKGTGSVTWCRPRAAPGGKTVYDVGVRFDDDWLRGDRGPLANALSRFFASTDSEPARDYTRVQTRLLAQGKGKETTVPLTITDMSEGGFKVTSAGSALPDGIKVGQKVRVSFGEQRRTQVTANVAWVADAPNNGSTVNAQFGVSFGKDDAAARDAVIAIISTLGKEQAEAPSITLEVI